jgi:hypothetical protein
VQIAHKRPGTAHANLSSYRRSFGERLPLLDQAELWAFCPVCLASWRFSMTPLLFFIGELHRLQLKPEAKPNRCILFSGVLAHLKRKVDLGEWAPYVANRGVWLIRFCIIIFNYLKAQVKSNCCSFTCRVLLA